MNTTFNTLLKTEQFDIINSFIKTRQLNIKSIPIYTIPYRTQRINNVKNIYLLCEHIALALENFITCNYRISFNPFFHFECLYVNPLFSINTVNIQINLYNDNNDYNSNAISNYYIEIQLVNGNKELELFFYTTFIKFLSSQFKYEFKDYLIVDDNNDDNLFNLNSNIDYKIITSTIPIQNTVDFESSLSVYKEMTLKKIDEESSINMLVKLINNCSTKYIDTLYLYLEAIIKYIHTIKNIKMIRYYDNFVLYVKLSKKITFPVNTQLDKYLQDSNITDECMNIHELFMHLLFYNIDDNLLRMTLVLIDLLLTDTETKLLIDSDIVLYLKKIYDTRNIEYKTKLELYTGLSYLNRDIPAQILNILDRI